MSDIFPLYNALIWNKGPIDVDILNDIQWKLLNDYSMIGQPNVRSIPVMRN